MLGRVSGIRNQIADFNIGRVESAIYPAHVKNTLTKTSGSMDLGLDLDSRHDVCPYPPTTIIPSRSATTRKSDLEIGMLPYHGQIDGSRHERRSCDWLWPSFCYRLPYRPMPVSSLSVRILCSVQAVIPWLSPSPTESRFCPAPTGTHRGCRQCGFGRSERQRHDVYDHRSIYPGPVRNAGCY